MPLADEPAIELPDDAYEPLEPAEVEDDGDAAEASGPSVLDDWIVYPSMGFGILVTTALPIFLEQRLCLPVLSALVLVPMFIWALREGRPRKAIQLGLFWAVVQSAVIVIATILVSQSASHAVLGGVEFRSEWLAWIANGSAVQRTPALALGQASVELMIYAAATFLTGSVAGLIALTAAMDRFNFTAATLLTLAARPLLMLVSAWPVWVIVRLVSYLIVGAVLAEPMVHLNLRIGFLIDWWRRRQRLLAIGLGLFALSLLLQLLLSPIYRWLLQAALGLNRHSAVDSNSPDRSLFTDHCYRHVHARSRSPCD